MDKKIQTICIIEIYSVMDQNEIQKVAEKEMKLEIMLHFSEIQILHICSHVWFLSFNFAFIYMHVCLETRKINIKKKDLRGRLGKGKGD